MGEKRKLTLTQSGRYFIICAGLVVSANPKFVKPSSDMKDGGLDMEDMLKRWIREKSSKKCWSRRLRCWRSVRHLQEMKLSCKLHLTSNKRSYLKGKEKERELLREEEVALLNMEKKNERNADSVTSEMFAECQMGSSIWPPSASHFVSTLRALVIISYFALTVFFYVRAPSGTNIAESGFPSVKLPATEYASVGAFGDMMIAMLGPTDVPFTLFVPSHAALVNVSSMFQKIEEKGEKLNVTATDSPTYAVLSHLLSFSAVPKPVLSKHVPVGTEVVYESLSGFSISVTRHVSGRGLLVNNITCAATDLQRGRFVIHVLNGVLMDFEFEQSMLQESAPADEEEDAKEDEGDISEDREHV